uniref:uncharacterized protein n=1 Tax=Semicossyphus pulcher TaxID=241346 RepID=UPI0037E96B70
MVDNTIAKPLGFFLIVTALMVFIECSGVEVTGILGTKVTLQFKFNISLNENSHFAVYLGPENYRKIAEYKNGESYTEVVFDACFPKFASAFCNISNLSYNDSGHYWATLFVPSGQIPPNSERVQLIVREENRSTASPMPVDIPTPDHSGNSSSTHTITAVLIVSPVVLLAVALCCLIWCLSRTKDKQEAPPYQTSNPTIQETIEASTHVPAPSLVYSVLDFPKRTSTVLEMNSNDTDYAAVRYLP